MTSASITLHSSHQAIPIERGSPLVGCLPEMARDPLVFFKRLANQYDDIVEFKLPMQSFALVTSAELCQQILVKENARFIKAERDINIMGALLGNGLVTNVPVASHKKHRKLIQPGFHFRRIESYAQTMVDYSRLSLQDWPESGTRDISQDMFRLTMYIVCKTLFDIDMEKMSDSAEEIGRYIHEFQTISDRRFKSAFQAPNWLPTPDNLRTRKIRQFLDQTINQMIEERKNADGGYEDKGDLLSMLLAAEYEDGGKMSKQQLMDELITLFVAGHETTSNALTWTFYLLATHPEIQQKLNEELDSVLEGKELGFEDLDSLKYTEMVIKESMRILPPVWTLTCRQASEDIVLGDYEFPKGKVLFVSPYANHHNPRYFPEPEKFDPERFTEENEKALPRYAYMPFGGGPRVCIGNSFAMMEAKLILAEIARNYRFELAEGQKLEPQALVTMSNLNGMRVKYQRRT